MTANSKLYIASKEVLNTNHGHLYIVYDEDGDLGTLGDQKVIRGGNDTAQTSAGLDLMLEIGVLIQESADAYGSNDTPFSRGTTEITVPNKTADALWNTLLLFANSLGQQVTVSGYTEGEIRNTGLAYDYLPTSGTEGFNSNSTVVSFLSQIGVRLVDVTPLNAETPLDPNDRYEVDYYPDYHNQYGGTNDDNFLLDNAVTDINGRDGVDAADFSALTTEIVVNLAMQSFLVGANSTSVNSIKNIENLTGTDFNDILRGDNYKNIIHGGDGNDVISGGGGVDLLYGEAGNDTLSFNVSQNSVVFTSKEFLSGGDGVDTLRLEMRSEWLSPALRSEILSVYNQMVQNPQSGGFNYTFQNINLQIEGFEKLELVINGKPVSITPSVTDTIFSNNFYGSFFNNTLLPHQAPFYYLSKPQYSLDDSISTIAGSFITSAGGAITVLSNGSFSYVLPSPSYKGVDSYTYTYTDASGYTGTSTAYFNIRDNSYSPPYGSEEHFVLNGANTPAYIANEGYSCNITASDYSDQIFIDLWDNSALTGNGYINGAGGDDDIFASSGASDYYEYRTMSVYGGDGNDVLRVGGFHVTIDGGNGDDVIHESIFYNATITGGAGKDIIRFGFDAESDYPVTINVNAGDDDDLISLISVTDATNVDYIIIDGGTGTDTLRLTDHHVTNMGVVVNLDIGTISANNATPSFISISNIENVLGTHYNDVILGNDADNVIFGWVGNDTLSGGLGNDILHGDFDTNKQGFSPGYSLYPETNDDTFLINLNEGVDQIYDFVGNDKIIFGAGILATNLEYIQDGNDLLIKHSGIDLVRLMDHFYNGAYGYSYNNTYGNSNIEVLKFSDNSTILLADIIFSEYKGTNGNDEIAMSYGNIKDMVNSGAGNDIIYTFAGNDEINADSGDDTIDAGLGNDIVNAGDGNDIIIHTHLDGAAFPDDKYYGGLGSDRLDLYFNSSITQQIREDILGYKDYLNNPANVDVNSATGSEYIFSTLGITAGRIEDFKVYLNGIEQSISVTAKDDTFSGVSNIAITGNVLANNGNGADTGFIQQLGVIAGTYTTTAGGTIVLLSNGDFTYTAPTGYGGTDSFVYTATDGHSGTDTATVSFNILAVVNGTSGSDTLHGTSGDDSLYGFDGNDTIYGYNGNDFIDGGLGNDVLYGGQGDDVYIVDSTSDSIIELVNQGIDSIQSSVTYNLNASVNVENLTLTGTAAINGFGNPLDNIIVGNSADNLLYGYSGNDTLNGGAGGDTMNGGFGDDIYYVDNSLDVVSESGASGNDTILTYISLLSLAANVENATAMGTSNLIIYGNALANILIGNSGNNQLDGGAGIDTMKGGDGNDLYYVDNILDVVIENANEGTQDKVNSTVTYTLGANIEQLALLGNVAINGTGNSLNNYLIGNSANNILYGGDGNDNLDGAGGTNTLYGGAGNDIYIINSATNTVIEYASEGTDLIISSVTWTLGANIENLTLTGYAAINGTGNALDNYLAGNNGNNILIGGIGNDTFASGYGVDTLYGGVGNDTYSISDVTSTIVEYLNEGIDNVESYVNFTLGNHVENLTLIGINSFNGTGNALANTIVGNAQANILTGLDGNDTLNGKAGLDTLVGGNGSDTFLFEADSAYLNRDIIQDFKTVQSDKIDISDLLSGYNSATHDIHDFVSISTSGTSMILSVDRDGTGTNFSSSEIAILSNTSGLDIDTMLTNGNMII